MKLMGVYFVVYEGIQGMKNKFHGWYHVVHETPWRWIPKSDKAYPKCWTSFKGKEEIPKEWSLEKSYDTNLC